MNCKLFSTLFSLLVVLVLGVAAAAAQEPSPGEALSSENESDQIVLNADFSAQAALGTSFTYQGRLSENGNPANGTYDFVFKLYDAQTAGRQIGSTYPVHDITIADGVFSFELDFGRRALIGGARFLQTAVRPGTSSDSYTSLTPRQRLTPSPYAIYASRASGLAAPDGSPTNAVIVDNNGKIGIGTNNPREQLHVYGRISTGDNMDSAGAVTFYPPDGAAWFHIDNGPAGGRSTGRLRISHGVNPGDHEIMNILQNGRVGIGTDWPQSTLDVRGRATTEILQITGGSDLSEQFDVRNDTAGLTPTPGMVACIDSEHPGELIICSQEYDQTVAGIISGAGGIKPGMLMGQEGSAADGEYPVALTGRVYVQADASNGAIQPGDLLTSSDVPGHAMKVTDYDRAQGAILGKAMTGLEEGQGLVLVLVSLQ